MLMGRFGAYEIPLRLAHLIDLIVAYCGGPGVFISLPSNVMFGNPRRHGFHQQIMHFETSSKNALVRNTSHCIFSKQVD